MAALRQQLRLFYFVYFASGSGFMVFRNAYLDEIGLTGFEMGLIGLLIPVCGVVSQPIWGMVGDWGGLQKEILLAGVGVTGVAILAYPLGPVVGVLTLAGATIVFAVFRAPIRPVANSLVLSTGTDYGQVRAFGSLAFGVSSVGFGVLVSQFGTPVVFYLYTLGMAAVAVILLRLPVETPPPTQRIGIKAVRLTRQPDFAALLVAAFLLGLAIPSGSAYLSVYMRAIGASDTVTGAAFAAKTMGEIGVFLLAYRIDRSYRSFLVAGCLCHAFTYAVYATVTIPVLILGIQLVLGVGYAAAFLAMVNLAHRLAPTALQSTAQTFLSGIGIAGGAGIGHVVAGHLMDVVGVQAMYGYVAVIAVAAALVSLLVDADETSGTAHGER